jgi:membrane-associated PAP2 superfamily phosphatase
MRADEGGASAGDGSRRPMRLLAYDNALALGLMMGIMNLLRGGDYLKVAFVVLTAGWR